MDDFRGRSGDGGGGAVAKKPSRNAYDDVFGGPPRFSVPFPTRVNDYAEIFGGFSGSCSIPFLDLATDGGGGGGAVGRGVLKLDYAEIFGGLDFGEFAIPYEELVVETKRAGDDEDGVWALNERTPKETTFDHQAKEAAFGHQAKEATFSHQAKEATFSHQAKEATFSQQAKEATFSHQAKEATFSHQAKEATFGHQAKEATFGHQAKEAFSIPSKSSNLILSPPPKDNEFTSHANHPTGLGSNEGVHRTTLVDERNTGPKFSVLDDLLPPSQSKESDDLYFTVTRGLSEMILPEKSPSGSSGVGSRDSEIDQGNTQKQTTSDCPDSENDNANVYHHSRSSSSHSVSSVDAPYLDPRYVSVSDISLRTRPLRVPPPSRPPPKLVHKMGNSTPKTTSYGNDKNAASLMKAISGEGNHETNVSSKSQTVNKVVKESSSFFDVEVDVSSAAAASAAAMKEAMQLAETRLRIAKDSMERKRDYFNNSKKMINEDMKRKEKKIDKTSSFNDLLMHTTVVEDDKQTHKMASKERPEFTNAAEETANSDEIFTVMQKDVIEEDKVIDMTPNERTEVAVPASVNVDSVEAELNVQEAKEVQEMIPRIVIESPQPLSEVVEESENLKTNQEDFELVNNQKDRNADLIFEQNAIRHKTESTIKINNGVDNVDVEPVLPYDLESHNDLVDKCKESEMEDNFALRDSILEKKEIKEIPSMIPEDFAYEEKVNELGRAGVSHEEETKLLEDRNILEEVKEPCAGEQSSTSSESEKHLEPSGDCDFQLSSDTNENEKSLECVHEVCETEAILNRLDGSHDDATCERSENEEKLYLSEVTTVNDENDSELPHEATNDFRVSEPTIREEQDKSVSAENECELKGSKGAQEQEASEAILERTQFTLIQNEVRLEVELDLTDQIIDDLSSQEEKGVTQNFEEKTITEEKNSLLEDFGERKNEKSEKELQHNFKSDESDETASRIGNAKDQNVEFHNMGKAENVDAFSEVLERPMNGHLDIQQADLFERQRNILSSTVDVRENSSLASEKANGNMMKMELKQRERRMEKVRELTEGEARKLEEEKERDREREREREKDRIAVERATREAHERAYAEAKERADRIAVERVTADFRQRALKEAREKAEKASAEALEKSLAEKAQREAMLRAGRAAVERATIEARERAVEKALAEKAALDAKERTERYTAAPKDKMRRETVIDNLKVGNKDWSHGQFQNGVSSSNSQGVGESALRYKARLERHRRTADRAARAVAEMNTRDILAQREQAERNRLAEYLDADVKRWSNGKEGNLRALLSTLQYILGPESGWQPISLTDVITAPAMKKAYRKATLCVHPDKLQQRGASIQQKYICEKVFDLLKEAWNKYNSEER